MSTSIPVSRAMPWARRAPARGPPERRPTPPRPEPGSRTAGAGQRRPLRYDDPPVVGLRPHARFGENARGIEGGQHQRRRVEIAGQSGRREPGRIVQDRPARGVRALRRREGEGAQRHPPERSAARKFECVEHADLDQRRRIEGWGGEVAGERAQARVIPAGWDDRVGDIAGQIADAPAQVVVLRRGRGRSARWRRR